MISKRQKDFKSNLEILFNTESGRKVLKYLKEDFLDGSAIGETPEQTYYNIGQQDLVKLMIQSLEDKESLDLVSTVNYEL